MDEIGSKIRWLRKSRAFTLEEFAQKLGMTEPHLSLIENGKRGVSIPILRRILYSLNTNLAAFFSSSFHDHKVVYSEKDGILLPSLKSARIKLLVPIEGGRLLASSECVIRPGGSLGKPSSHKGEEFGYTLSGKGVLVLDGKEYPFRQGDCFYYEAFIPHTIRNASSKESLRLLVVATPPSF
jgi:transcriptional regulator with XRE-family HTH domain